MLRSYIYVLELGFFENTQIVIEFSVHDISFRMEGFR